MAFVYVAGGVLLLLVLAGVVLYNRLVTFRQRVNEAWSDIDVQLKRRHDLIPNLVETVKGYAAHESGVFDAVTMARAAAVAVGAGTPTERAGPEAVLTGALRSVFAVAEAYPQLKAIAAFNDLSARLTETENKIEAGRRFYNTQVRDYDTTLQSVPYNLLAGPLGFKSAAYFELAAPAEAQAPQVALR